MESYSEPALGPVIDIFVRCTFRRTNYTGIRPISISKSQKSLIDFPEYGSGTASTFTLFSTRTIDNVKNLEFTDFMYQSQYIADCNELESQTSQASGLCRRINLAPIQMQITISPKLGYVQLISVFFSFVVSIIFGGLQFVTKYGWKYCCNSTPARSTSSFVAPFLMGEEGVELYHGSAAR